MHVPPDAVDPVAQEVVKVFVPEPPAAIAAQGCGAQVRASVLQLEAVQERTTLPA